MYYLKYFLVLFNSFKDQNYLNWLLWQWDSLILWWDSFIMRPSWRSGKASDRNRNCRVFDSHWGMCYFNFFALVRRQSEMLSFASQHAISRKLRGKRSIWTQSLLSLLYAERKNIIHSTACHSSVNTKKSHNEFA